MDGLNYHHLQYFWVVAKEGSIAQAAARLKVSQPTISIQLKRLDDALKKKLFRKRGRHLELTATGRQVYEYADRIFTIGGELGDILNGRTVQSPKPFVVGVQTGIPAMMVDRILRPILHRPEPIRLVIQRDDLLPLVADLGLRRLHLVLSAEPVDAASLSRAVCRPIAEAEVILTGREDVLQRHRRGFPKSLEQAPLLMPSEGSPFRRHLDGWFDAHRIKPAVIAESDDPAYLQILADAGHGLLPVPTSAEPPSTSPTLLGPLPDLTLRFYALHRDEPLMHPALAAVLA